MSDPEYTRRTRTYAHVRRLSSLHTFNSLVNIGTKTIIQDEFGEEMPSYPIAEQLTGIGAYKEPKTAGTGERRQDDETIVTNQWLVYLQGYFPAIKSADRAYIDGVPHNIINVAHDDSKTLTMLETEIINAESESVIPL